MSDEQSFAQIVYRWHEIMFRLDELDETEAVGMTEDEANALAGERRALQQELAGVPIKDDEFVKSPFYPHFVIPVKAGIQLNQAVVGSPLRGSDDFSDFLRDHQKWRIKKWT